MGAPQRDRLTIPVTCQVHGGAAEFSNLRVSRVDGGIVFDPHVTGACVITLRETDPNQLFDALGE